MDVMALLRALSGMNGAQAQGIAPTMGLDPRVSFPNTALPEPTVAQPTSEERRYAVRQQGRRNRLGDAQPPVGQNPAWPLPLPTALGIQPPRVAAEPPVPASMQQPEPMPLPGPMGEDASHEPGAPQGQPLVPGPTSQERMMAARMQARQNRLGGAQPPIQQNPQWPLPLPNALGVHQQMLQDLAGDLAAGPGNTLMGPEASQWGGPDATMGMDTVPGTPPNWPPMDQIPAEPLGESTAGPYMPATGLGGGIGLDNGVAPGGVPQMAQAPSVAPPTGNGAHMAPSVTPDQMMGGGFAPDTNREMGGGRPEADQSLQGPPAPQLGQGITWNGPRAQVEPPEGQKKGGLFSLFANNPNFSNALMMTGLGMMAAGGRPGATFLGSLGEGGLNAAKHMANERRLDVQDKRLASQDELARQRLLQAAQQHAETLAQRAQDHSLDAAERERAHRASEDLKRQIAEMQRDIAADRQNAPRYQHVTGPLGENLSFDTRSGTSSPSRMTDQNGKETNPGNTAGMPTDTFSKLSGKTGPELDAALKEADPQLHAQVKAIIAGRAAWPTATRGQGVMLARLASSIDPSAGPARQAAVKAFLAGPDSNTAASANMAIFHAGTLFDAIDGLNNNSLVPRNVTANWIKQNLSDPAVKRYDIAHSVVATEVPKLLKGAGVLNEQEELMWQRNLARSQGPDSLKTALSTMVDLLKGRMQALNHKMQLATGAPAEDFPILSDEAKRIIERLERADKTFGSTSKSSPAGESAQAYATRRYKELTKNGMTSEAAKAQIEAEVEQAGLK